MQKDPKRQTTINKRSNLAQSRLTKAKFLNKVTWRKSKTKLGNRVLKDPHCMSLTTRLYQKHMDLKITFGIVVLPTSIP